MRGRHAAWGRMLLACVAIWPVPNAVSARQYTPAEYVRTVRLTADALSEAVRQQSRGAGGIPQELRGGVEELSRPADVRRDGRVVRVGPVFDPEDAALLLPPGRTPSLDSLMSGLRRARLALSALGGAPDEAGQARIAAAERTVRRVVESAEFRPGKLEDLLLRAQHAVILFLSRLLGASFAGGRSGAVQVITRLLIGLVAASLAMLAWYVLSHAPRRHASTHRPATGEESEVWGVAAAIIASRDALANGDFLNSLRLAYRSLLLRLDETGVLRLTPGMTNREAIRSISQPDALAVLRPATELFDDRFYGRRETTASDCRQLLDLHKALGTGA